ncbi:MAG: hypothetical protein Q9160_004227 [Pyrenula sp. 1 TL-2023]
MASQNSSSLDPEQEFLKRSFEEQNPHVPFDLGQETLLKLSPRFFESTLRLRGVPRRHGCLSPKIQSLISLSLSSSLTTLHPPTIASSTRAALSHGATPVEILETLQLTSTLGIHACNIGVPILVDVLKSHDPKGYEEEFGRAKDAEREDKMKDEFTRNRGYWHTFWNDFLRLDPDFFEAYLEFSSVPWTRDTASSTTNAGADVDATDPPGLPPKIKELIYIAFDASATHLYTPGLKLHMENAVRLGATAGEIMEVLEIAGGQGVVAAEEGARSLGEALRERERESGRGEKRGSGV